MCFLRFLTVSFQYRRHRGNRGASSEAGLDVDVEYALDALCPGHRCPTFGRRLHVSPIGGLRFVALAPLNRCHQGAVCLLFGTLWAKAHQKRRKARIFHVSPRYTVTSILLDNGDISTASETVFTATETTMVSLSFFAPCFSTLFIASILLFQETG